MYSLAPPSLSSSAIRTLDQDNPYHLQDFEDPYVQSLSDIRSISNSLTGNQTHDVATQLPSFQAFARHQENTHKHINAATYEYNPYDQPLSIGSIENWRNTSQPTADRVYEGYGLAPSKPHIRPALLTGTTTTHHNVVPRPYGQMSVTSKGMKNIVPPDYYMQQMYK